MTINCSGQLIDLSTPKIMGILNITPDSFFDGGKYADMDAVLNQTELMLAEGATFIDIGAYSSRPGAKHISEQDELDRIVPVVEAIQKSFPNALLSIDTFRSNVAKACITKGAHIINDISAGNMDKHMFETVAELQVPYIIMHMKGTPQNMQQHQTYNNITAEVLKYFSEKIFSLRKLGLNDIIIDVGFGFAKTMDHNYELLANLEMFQSLNIPNLVGVSRKSMIYKLLETSPLEALNGTTVLNTIALLNGAHILRVHDVKEAAESLRLVQKIKQHS